MNADGITKRLAFIKYLNKTGQEQAKRPEPLCWASILTLHDAVELFLQLVAEYAGVDAAVKDIQFMHYWSKTQPLLAKLGKPALTHRIAMERLNNARVNFKHYSNPPAKSAITGSYAPDVNSFLEDNSSAIFNITLATVSLVNLVTCQATQAELTQAEKLKQTGQYQEAITHARFAFNELIDDYEATKTDNLGRSPFDFLGLGFDCGFDVVRQSVKSLEEAVKIIGFGIDFKRYGKFKLLTPYVYKSGNDRYYKPLAVDPETSKSHTAVDADFCIDFVIESALALQEFDFALSSQISR
jgi:hypothetical protein